MVRRSKYIRKSRFRHRKRFASSKFGVKKVIKKALKTRSNKIFKSKVLKVMNPRVEKKMYISSNSGSYRVATMGSGPA